MALPLLVYQKTRSSGDFALALMAETIPWVVCAPLLAPYLQRFSAKNTLLFSDFMRALICLVIAFSVWSRSELFVLMFLMGTCSSIYGAFRIQTVRAVVAKEDITKFLGLSNGGNETIAMIAPLVGASLITFGFSPTLFMVFDSSSFLISFALLATLPTVSRPVRSETESKTRNPFKLLTRIEVPSSVKAITLSESLRSVAEGLFIPGLLTLLIQVQTLGEAEYAWVRSCMAIAGIASAYIFVQIEKRWSESMSHTVSTVMIITGVLLIPFVPGFIAALILGFLIGFGMSFKQILSDSIVITRSVERFQAEIITIINSIISLSYCLGYAVSAHWDKPEFVRKLFVIAGGFMGLSLFFGPSLKVAKR
jgi:predicted MFS family arabinose efflux permease